MKKKEDRIMNFLFVFVILMVIAWVGILGWAIIQLVEWITGYEW